MCVFLGESLSAAEDWPGKLPFPGHLHIRLSNAADSQWRLLRTYYVPGMVLSVLLWPPDAKSWLIWKDPDAGKDWGWEEKGTTEDEMVGWHHRLSGHEFEWTLGVGDGQGGLACCGPWGCRELDMTEWLNSTELNPFNLHNSPVRLLLYYSYFMLRKLGTKLKSCFQSYRFKHRFEFRTA